METKHIEVKILLGSVFSIVAVDYFFYLFFSHSILSDVERVGMVRIFQTICILSIVYYFNAGFSAIGLRYHGVIHGLKRGSLWVAGFGGITMVGLACIYLSGMNPLKLFKTNLPSGYKDLIVFLIIGGMIGPVSEEIFFRGVVFGFFRKWGVFFAIIATTLFFVAVHTPGRGIPVTQIVGGVLFAVSYEIEKNLIVPLMIHILGNIAIFSLSILSGYA